MIHSGLVAFVLERAAAGGSSCSGCVALFFSRWSLPRHDLTAHLLQLRLEAFELLVRQILFELSSKYIFQGLHGLSIRSSLRDRRSRELEEHGGDHDGQHAPLIALLDHLDEFHRILLDIRILYLLDMLWVLLGIALFLLFLILDLCWRLTNSCFVSFIAFIQRVEYIGGISLGLTLLASIFSFHVFDHGRVRYRFLIDLMCHLLLHLRAAVLLLELLALVDI